MLMQPPKHFALIATASETVKSVMPLILFRADRSEMLAAFATVFVTSCGLTPVRRSGL